MVVQGREWGGTDKRSVRVPREDRVRRRSKKFGGQGVFRGVVYKV